MPTNDTSTVRRIDSQGDTENADSVMTIRQMCDTFGVTARALRFYESKELLFPARKGVKRLYSRRDRARLKLLLRGKKYGLSLEEIRQLLDLYDQDRTMQLQIARSCEIGRAHLARLRTQRAELDVTIDALANEIDCCEEKLARIRANAEPSVSD